MREIAQTLSLVIGIFIPKYINFIDIVRCNLGNDSLNTDNIIFYILLNFNNWIAGVLLSACILCFWIRRYNGEAILNSGNRYHDKPYFWYVFCSYILGYKRCNLVLVPIYTQYRLVLNDIFSEYLFAEDLLEEKPCRITVVIENEWMCDNTINLVIEDTYPIRKHQLPIRLRETYTVFVNRERKFLGERVYCKELIEKVIEVIKSFDKTVNVNIFSTTNSKNTYGIIKQAIATATRGNIRHVYVFQQEEWGERVFIDKEHKIR